MNTIDAFDKHVVETNRFEKMEWLKESCSEEHIKKHFLNELVNWLGEDDFDEFYEWHCSVWEIKSPDELAAIDS